MTPRQAKAEQDVKDLRDLISENFNPDEHTVLIHFEEAVTVVVAQKYEAIIAERVRDEVQRLSDKTRVEAADKAKAAFKLEQCSNLASILEHMHEQNYGLAQDDLQELLENLRGY